MRDDVAGWSDHEISRHIDQLEVDAAGRRDDSLVDGGRDFGDVHD